LEERSLLSFVAATNIGFIDMRLNTLVTADLRHNGILDLIAAGNTDTGGGVSVRLGNGGGTFSAPGDYFPGGGPASIDLGDFRGDGKLDLAVASSGSGTVGILLANGDGTFQETVRTFRAGSSPRSVAVADFRNDNKLDLVVVNDRGGDVNVLL